MTHLVTSKTIGCEDPLVWALSTNGLILTPVLLAAVLTVVAPEVYYQLIQEDEFLEWATFWAFVFAAGAYGVAALHERRTQGVVPWFLVGVSLFCVAVALEEISWGQRIIGYRPPTYFLAHNYQRELNLHNVFETSVRTLALELVIVGYDLVLPLVPESAQETVSRG